MAITSPSPFLNLPPELRINIYEYLLVRQIPLKGRTARLDEKYDIHTSILRVNKQIHDEARSVFFGRNTFYLTSMPPLRPWKIYDYEKEEIVEEEGSGAFEPPLQLKDLPHVRHLHIDLLYYPNTTRYVRPGMRLRRQGLRERGRIGPGVIAGAHRYVKSLVYVLRTVQQTLLSLRVCADVRRIGTEAISRSSTVKSDEYADEEEQPLDFEAVQLGFNAADASQFFASALSALSMQNISFYFDFADSYFAFQVAKDEISSRSLGFLMRQVSVARSEIRLKELLKELGDDDEEEEDYWRLTGGGEFDSSGHIKLMWPSSYK